MPIFHLGNSEDTILVYEFLLVNSQFRGHHTYFLNHG